MDDAVVLGSDLWLFERNWDAEAKKKFDAEESLNTKKRMQIDYVVTLILLARVVDADFQQNAARIAKATGGSVRSAPVKGLMRMWGKMENDHASEPVPQPACNIDMSRNGITYDNPDELKEGYAMMTKKYPSLRTKNNFRADFNAVEKSFGCVEQVEKPRLNYVCIGQTHTRAAHSCLFLTYSEYISSVRLQVPGHFG